MIELMQDLPDNVIAFNATGKITGDDYLVKCNQATVHNVFV